MAVNEDALIELYKTTLEELRHQEWIYVQAIIGTAILVPAFLVAIGFLLGSNSPVSSQYVLWAKWIIFGLAILLVVFLGLTIYRVNKRMEVCNNVSENIENKLRGVNEPEETSKFEGLLVRKELNKIKVEERFGRVRFRFYIPTLVAAFIVLGLVLFVFMK